VQPVDRQTRSLAAAELVDPAQTSLEALSAGADAA